MKPLKTKYDRLTKIFILLTVIFPSLFTAQSFKKTDYYRTSFLLKARLVILEATIDNQSGYFILDTGNPYLILHKLDSKTPESGSLNPLQKEFSIEGNNRWVRLKLGHWVLNRRLAREIDLSHLEKELNIPITGILGVDVLEQFEIMLDYQNTTITFYKLDKKGNRLYEDFESNSFDTIPIQLKNHLPCIKVQIDQQEFCLGLDSGASINLFSQECKNAITSKLYSKSSKITGIKKKTTIQKRFYFKPAIQVGKITTIPITTLFTDLTELNKNMEGPELHGLLGFGFLFQQKTAINFKKQEFYLWNRT